MPEFGFAIGILRSLWAFKMLETRQQEISVESISCKEVNANKRKGFGITNVAALTLILLVSTGHAQTVEDAVATWKKGDPRKAAIALEALAKSGNATAQTMLGYFYDEGVAGAPDYAKALIWYEKAAAQGQADAAFNMAVMYRDGRGTKKDDAKFYSGIQTAAKLGNPAAQYNLSQMYLNGDYMPKDGTKSVDWALKAAEGGDALAQFNMGVAFAQGEIVKLDYIQAYKWLSLASRQGIPNASGYAGSLMKKMPARDANEASRLVESWRPRLKY